ncbi:short-chain dehydrogenase [Mycobacterium colombiense]|uniref:SDR family NAD(P)-dependent oxidoreductase n=1 Tax=Mycobacterium colombiense TaxID=339268 RepID=UPI0007EC87DB|nr:SDR family oxidoreductase [Mycobacterium colombiense]OBJ17047.1 short-chain dehydrogenase [Mycobacterium colombiense]OBJ36108.1 short-chain dehydrogenase [Mycobacterium colombiense]OBJ39572.1 short-chain dehydrogenase [Mycobacterium colombiense]OBJ72898.1 short-chain dehydrogenase [Mycobacterium colombiense]
MTEKACLLQRFADRRVMVTGAGSGIGQATVARILDEGATVVAYDVSAEGLARTAAVAEDAGTAARLTTAVLDISSEDAVVAAVSAALAELGGLEVLINAAAIQRCANTHEHTLADWNATLAVNLTGTFLMTRQTLPALLASRRGVVVNFTSTAATFAHPYMAAYAASKGGVLSFTHSLALEYSKQGLRAVNIQPGGVATALALSTLDKMPQGYDLGLWAKQTPLLHGRDTEVLGDPSAVASVIAMVASDDGAFITGTEIRIDGGAHA